MYSCNGVFVSQRLLQVRFVKTFLKGSETLWEPFLNQEQDQEQKQDQEQNKHFVEPARLGQWEITILREKL